MRFKVGDHIRVVDRDGVLQAMGLGHVVGKIGIVIHSSPDSWRPERTLYRLAGVPYNWPEEQMELAAPSKLCVLR